MTWPRALRVPPSLPADCANQQLTGNNPQITAPLKGVTYTFRIGKPESIALRANRDGQGTIYWFANDSFIGKSEIGVGITWQPQKTGRYVLRAVDAASRSDSREVNVEFVN